MLSPRTPQRHHHCPVVCSVPVDANWLMRHIPTDLSPQLGSDALSLKALGDRQWREKAEHCGSFIHIINRRPKCGDSCVSWWELEP